MAAGGSPILDVLRGLLAARTDVALVGANDAGALLAAFTAASRRVGKAPLVLDDGETARVAASGVDWPVATRLDELWRVALLVGAATRPDVEVLVRDAFRGGDTDERRAVLRALPLLPDPRRFAAVATDACRTSVLPIFEAIACENPFPVRHLEATAFNQMVLKALFLDVSLARVIGLDGRRTPELTRMARDYAAERRAAGRVVSDDLAALAGDRG